MIKLFTLGKQFISDFLLDNEVDERTLHDLQLILEEETGAVRLETTAPLNKMFGRYFYRSGINETMKNELKNIVNSILPLVKCKEGDVFCDLACNDGTLLSFVPQKFIRVGIDPADDSYKTESEKHADLIIQDYFTSEVFKKSKFGNKKIKIITCIAMFYDIDKPDNFLKDVYDNLDDDGLFVMQLSHSGLMIKQCAFDNILSEHIYYYTLTSLNKYLERNGFTVSDCSLNETNGGSMRVYITKAKSKEIGFATQPYRDVCKFRIESLLDYEKKLKLDSFETWENFYSNIKRLKETTVSFIKQEKARGKSIWGYGASTKGNVLLQHFGLDNTLIDGIAERSPAKYGLRTVGSNIKIYSEEEMREAKPDYLLILPWHFINEFKEREKDLLASGTKFIVPCPTFEII